MSLSYNQIIVTTLTMSIYKRSPGSTSQKSPLPRSKSPLPSRHKTLSKYSSTEQNLNIRKCKTLISLTQLQLVIQDLIKNRQRILPCIELHQLLFQSRLPPRCIEHNNAVSLYCTNEHKILCVNCVYNSLKHKTHKVNPLKDSLSDVRGDVAKMQSTLEKEYIQIKNQIQISNSNQLLIDQTLTKMLDGLEKEFDQISKYLTSKYIELKSQIIENYHKILTSTCVITGQFEWLKMTLDATLVNLNKPLDDEHLVRKQLLLSRILEHTGARCKSIRREEVETMVGQFSRQVAKMKDKLQAQRWLVF